jgi:hypothetical protein
MFKFWNLPWFGLFWSNLYFVTIQRYAKSIDNTSVRLQRNQFQEKQCIRIGHKIKILYIFQNVFLINFISKSALCSKNFAYLEGIYKKKIHPILS